MKAKLTLCLALALWATFAPAQADDGVKNSLLKHTLVVRGYYTSSDLRFDESGRLVSPATSGFGAADARVFVTDVQLKPERLIIVGRHSFPVYDQTSKNFALSIAGEKVTIEIALPADRPAGAAVPDLLKQVFLTQAELQNKCSVEEQERFRAWVASPLDEKHKSQKLPEAQTLSQLSAYCFPTGEKAYLTGQGIRAPQPISLPDPDYSESARRQGFQGSLAIVMIIDEKGQPTTLYVSKATGHGLDEQALKAIRQWRFEPATFQGNPVPVALSVEFRFAPGEH